MCGIVGVAGVITNKEERAFRELLIVDSLRGVDSTGMVSVPRHNGDIKIAKQIGNPYDLFELNAYDKAMGGIHRAIIGHNRWSTMGKSTRANAHPFDYDTVVGVHNGTVNTKYKMLNGNDFAVDSAAIFNHIDKRGVRDLMSVMDGAWALVWWDKVTQSLNFLRNKERPLMMCPSEDGKNLFWASESWMLQGILGRNGIERGDIELLPQDVLMTIEIEKDGTLGKPHMSPCASTFPGWAPYSQVPSAHRQQQQSNVTVLPVVKKEESKNTGVAPVTANQTPGILSTQASGSGLANSKGVVLEVLSLCETDGFGGQYLTCHYDKYPFAKIRWYFPRSVEPTDFIGESIVADLSDCIIRGARPAYYKVRDSSVQLVDDIDPVGGEEEKTYEDFRGRPLSYNDWVSAHGDCSFCTADIAPTDPHAFNSAGQAFCQDCMKSDNVKSVTSFTKLFA